MIFVNKDHQYSQFKSLDIPFGFMREIDFKQPVFGSNKLVFKLSPYNGMLPGQCSVKLYFKNGGCDGFLKVFDYVI